VVLLLQKQVIDAHLAPGRGKADRGGEKRVGVAEERMALGLFDKVRRSLRSRGVIGTIRDSEAQGAGSECVN